MWRLATASDDEAIVSMPSHREALTSESEPLIKCACTLVLRSYLKS